METANSMIGQRFGLLVVVAESPGPPRSWVCVCDCGGSSSVPTNRLRSGNTKSCGCRKRAVLGEATRKHGMANSSATGYASRAYGIWQAMKDRCSNRNRADYKYYGGKGVTVCARWLDFENFLADMGEPPPGMTLDRERSDGNYAPGNCRWATRKTQTYNSSRIHWVVFGGERKSVADWCRTLGISTSTWHRRIRAGLTTDQIIAECK